MQYFGIKDTDTPAFAIHDAASNGKYLLANASPEDLTSFVAEFEVSLCCFCPYSSWAFTAVIKCLCLKLTLCASFGMSVGSLDHSLHHVCGTLSADLMASSCCLQLC